MSFNPGITVGSSTFTDLVYASYVGHGCHESFSDSASHLGLNISWPKTKLQNTGSGPKPPDISVDSNVVESVYSFDYIGSLQSSDGQCHPDLTCRIGLACAVMTSLKRILSDKRLTLDTKLRIYRTLILSVLLYAADTWTLLSADARTLDDFHQKYLSPKWWSTTTDRSDFNVHLLSRRRISVLSHVSRLDDDTPANVALRDDDDGDRVRVKYGGRCPQWLISGGRYPRGANVIHSSSSLRDLYGSSRTCDSAARRRRVGSRRVTCINHRLIFDIVSHLRVAPERGADRCARQ